MLPSPLPFLVADDGLLTRTPPLLPRAAGRPVVEELVAAAAALSAPPTDASESAISASPLRTDEVAEPEAPAAEATPEPEPSLPSPAPEPDAPIVDAPVEDEPSAVVETEEVTPAAEEEQQAAPPPPPPAAAAPPSPPPAPAPAPVRDTAELDSLRSTVAAQKQTISLLTSEKTQQAAQLDRLDAAQADLAKRTDELSDSRSTVGRLKGRVASLEGERKDLNAQVERLTGRNKELQAAEGFRDEVAKLKKSEAALQKRIAEAEERKKADDEKEGGQVKELEESLERTRKHEASLEREVGRLKTVRAPPSLPPCAPRYG